MAGELLATKPLSVKEVAFEVGYSSESHFISNFQNRYGVSPARYRLGDTDSALVEPDATRGLQISVLGNK